MLVRTKIARARYFQALKTEYSKERYVACLSRLLAFVAYSVSAEVDIGLQDTEVVLIKSVMYGHNILDSTKSPVLSLSVDTIAVLLSTLFFRSYLINYKRWEDPVFVYWSYLGVEKQNEFKSPRLMTQAIAALKYSIRLTVLYFSIRSQNNSE